MIFDSTNLFSDGQTVNATGASTNVIDLGVASPGDLGAGRPIPLQIQLVADATGTSPTLKAEVETSADEAFSSPTTVASSNTLSGGKAGDVLSLNFVPSDTSQRYVRLKYTVGGTSPVYKVTAGIVMGRQTNQ